MQVAQEQLTLPKKTPSSGSADESRLEEDTDLDSG